MAINVILDIFTFQRVWIASCRGWIGVRVAKKLDSENSLSVCPKSGRVRTVPKICSPKAKVL